MSRSGFSGSTGGGGSSGNVTIVPGERIHKYSRGDASGSLPITYIGYTVPVGKALDIENWHFSGEGDALMVMDIDDGVSEFEIDSIRISGGDDTENHRFTGMFGINTPLRVCGGSIIRLRLRERESSSNEYITGFNAVLRTVSSCTSGASGGQVSGDSGEQGGGGTS